MLVIVLAAFLNVMMNFLLKRASQRPTLSASMQSLLFVGALTVGTAAVVVLLFVYRSGFSLARGVLLLGASSVLIGLGLGLLLGDRLQRSEWFLAAALLVFYIGSWMVRA